MSSPDRPDPSRQPSSPRGEESIIYSERIHLPWWMWAVALGIALTMSVTAGYAVRSMPGWVPFLVFVLMAVVLCVSLGRSRVWVTSDDHGDGTLYAGGARLPFEAIGRTLVVPPTARRAALGYQLDPLAFLATRSGVHGLVLVMVDDPSDPTPYWLISTRRPDALVDALPSSTWQQDDPTSDAAAEH